MRRRPLILGVLLALVAGLLGAATAEAKLVLKKAGSFNKPIYVTSPPGDVTRLIVVQRGGTIKVLKNGVVQSEPFLKVPEVEMDLAAESGLLSIAFDPEYATTGLFYVAYVKECGRVIGVDTGCPLRVDEYRQDTRNRADPASRRKVLQIPHPDTPYHYGGQLQFGPDGYLYISVGDGGNEPDNGQDKSTLLGKMLRIDPAPSLEGRPYSIPPGNPFALDATARPEIWAYGLRNPWRFSFDRGTGAMVIGDVGANNQEEVNYQEPGEGGANYGWPKCQGTSCSGAPPPDYEPPDYSYSHPDEQASRSDAEDARVVRHPIDDESTCRAITGGFVSRDLTVPETFGRYVFGDYCVGDISLVTLPAEPDDNDYRATDLNPGHLSLVSFGQDARCHIYAVSADGPLWRIASTREPLPGQVSEQSGCAAPPAP